MPAGERVNRYFPKILVKIRDFWLESTLGSGPARGDFHPLESSLGGFFDSNATYSSKKIMHIVGVSVLVYINMFKSITLLGSTLSASGRARESLIS